MKIQSGTLAPGIFLAGLAAGPLYLTIAMLMDYLRTPGMALPVDSAPLMMFTLFLMPATVVGAFIALPVNALGAGIMMKIGEVADCACSRLAWTLSGAVMGLIAALLLDLASLPQAFIALVLTSAACAWLCVRGVKWVDENEADEED